MTTWSYRVIDFGDDCLQICRVSYDGEGDPYHWQEVQVTAGANYMELQEEVNRLHNALRMPRLRITDFPNHQPKASA
jgi:hypothetical protein